MVWPSSAPKMLVPHLDNDRCGGGGDDGGVDGGGGNGDGGGGGEGSGDGGGTDGDVGGGGGGGGSVGGGVEGGGDVGGGGIVGGGGDAGGDAGPVQTRVSHTTTDDLSNSTPSQVMSSMKGAKKVASMVPPCASLAQFWALLGGEHVHVVTCGLQLPAPHALSGCGFSLKQPVPRPPQYCASLKPPVSRTGSQPAPVSNDVDVSLMQNPEVRLPDSVHLQFACGVHTFDPIPASSPASPRLLRPRKMP